MLSRHLPFLTAFDRTLAIVKNDKQTTTLSIFKTRMCHCLHMMRKKHYKKVTTAQCRYNDHYCHRTRPTSSFKLREWVYVDCLRLTATGADWLGTNSCTKDPPPILGPYRIFLARIETASNRTMIINRHLCNELKRYVAVLVSSRAAWRTFCHRSTSENGDAGQ